MTIASLDWILVRLDVGHAENGSSRDPLYLGVVVPPDPARQQSGGGQEWRLWHEGSDGLLEPDTTPFVIGSTTDYDASTFVAFPRIYEENLTIDSDYPPVVYLRKGVGADPTNDDALQIDDVHVRLMHSEDPDPFFLQYKLNQHDPIWLSVFRGLQVWPLYLRKVDGRYGH